MHKIQTSRTAIPALIRLGKVETMDSNIYYHEDRYDHIHEIIKQNEYWAGAEIVETRTKGFSIQKTKKFKTDKSRKDDTKVK
jgi:hypothetical protein|tara:strand:- start:396 stop:641 length:246 start_codon:yes stop_codon:yes gene_type:complete